MFLILVMDTTFVLLFVIFFQLKRTNMAFICDTFDTVLAAYELTAFWTSVFNFLFFRALARLASCRNVPLVLLPAETAADYPELIDNRCCQDVGAGVCRRSAWLLFLLLLLLHLITHPTKCYTNSKVRALSEKTNSEQVRLQVFRKSRWTNCQVPQFDRQLIPTAGTSNSKGSQAPIRPVARHNKIPTNSGS